MQNIARLKRYPFLIKLMIKHKMHVVALTVKTSDMNWKAGQWTLKMMMVAFYIPQKIIVGRWWPTLMRVKRENVRPFAHNAKVSDADELKMISPSTASSSAAAVIRWK